VGGRQLTEYYHRGVVAHLIGLELPLVLDIEMVLHGQGEIVAARRLLQRLLTRYARFFDAVAGDALYLEAPFWQLCRQHGKHLLAVLKENNPALLADAKAVLAGPPDLERGEKTGRLIQYWDQEEFTSGSLNAPVRALRTQETWLARQRIARQWVEREQTAEWFWATSIPQTLMPTRQIAQAGHARWSIENRVFNTLGAHWGLNHCFHHQPAAILNFILILFIAFTLVSCFHRLNLKQPARARFTLIALATELLISMASFGPRPAAWLGRGGRPP
jgi:hypothetical protein